MEVKELKFLLKLVGRENYRGKISELKPNSKTKISETEKICRTLCDRELVTCSKTITKIKIHSAGKALLQVDADNLPVNQDELKILKACATKEITPGKTKVTPAQKREELITSLVERGLITATATKIEQVQLTERGKKNLLEEYNAKGTGSVLSLDLLDKYVLFLRKNLRLGLYQSQTQVNQEANSNGKKPQVTKNGQDSSNGKKPTDEEILQTIIGLDRQLGANNYLPIFHLRNPPSARQNVALKDYEFFLS